MKRTVKRVKRYSKIPVIGDMLFSLFTLPCAMGFIKEVNDNPNNTEVIYAFVLAFVLLGIARLFRAFRFRRKSRIQFIKFIVYGLCILAGCFISLFLDEIWCYRILVFIYLGILIADRVISCYLNHRLSNLVMNLLAIFLFGSLYVELHDSADLLWYVMFFVAIHSLLSIVAVSFARVNLKALSNVIRKTYAAEIILGLVLLIFAFSYVLRYVEPNMDSLTDGLWYCFAIVTTIGFGDITATSFMGRLLSVILGIYGIIVVALITSVIVNFYGEMKREDEDEDGEDYPDKRDGRKEPDDREDKPEEGSCPGEMKR